MPSYGDFNEICYLNRYPDLKVNGWMYKSADGTWKYGNPSHRETRRLTDPGNAFWHWQNFGLGEGRVCGCDLAGTNYSLEFNAAAYLARYPDVRGTSILPSDWGNNPEGHYRSIGIQQGRHPGFEIITSQSPVGMVSPGTTTIVLDQPSNNQTPGDGTIITVPVEVIPDDTDIGQDNTSDIGTWVAGNPLLVGGLIIGGLILYHESKKNRSRRTVINHFR